MNTVKQQQQQIATRYLRSIILEKRLVYVHMSLYGAVFFCIRGLLIRAANETTSLNLQ